MKKFKKVLAVVTALAMVMAPVTAMADGNLGGSTSEDTGYLEGVTPDDVYAVVLPYVADGAYDFILDPEQLLTMFDQTYASDATLYFKATKDDTSSIATAVNKGSQDIVLDVEASFSVSGTSIDVVTNGAFTADKPSIALSIVAANKGTVSNSALDVTASTPEALTATGASIKTSIATTSGSSIAFGENGKANATFLISGTEDNFYIDQLDVATSEAISGHKYVYKATDSAVWSTVGFAIQGEANTLADWTEVNDATYTLSLKVVYTLSKLTDGQKAEMVPDASGNAVTADATTGLIEFEGTVSEEEEEEAQNLTTDGSALTISNIQAASITSAVLTPVNIVGSNKAAITLNIDKQHYTFNSSAKTFTLNTAITNTLASNQSTRGDGTYRLVINGTEEYIITVDTQ